MKTLIIGRAPSDYNSLNYEIFAPYCFSNSEKESEYIEKNYFSDLKLNKTEKKEIDRKTSEFTKKTINDVLNTFNQLNGVSYSYKFWEKVLYSWLIALIQHAYERQLQVKRMLSNVEEPFRVTLLKENINWNIHSTTDFFDLIYSVEYNQWVVSRFIEKLAPKNWVISYEEMNVEPKENNNRVGVLSRIKRILFSFIFKRTVKIYGFSFFDRLRMELKLRLKKPIIVKDSNKKINKKSTTEEIQFSYPLKKLMEYTQPRFTHQISRKVKKYERKFIQGKIILGGSQYLRGDDDFKLQIGLAVENDELFIGVQHGGDDYGMLLHCDEIFVNEFDNFRFVTWGWNQHSTYSNAKFIGLPSPYLNKFRDKHKCKEDKIILVGTRAHLSNRFLSARPSDVQWIEYRLNKLKLINHLHSLNFHNFFYKSYPKTYGSLVDAQYFSNKVPSLNIIKKDFHQRMMECKLLILDHPGTTLNLALVANIPTILFWSEDHFPMENNAQLFIEEFKENNMFFSDYKMLSSFIENEYDTISDWWNDTKIQNLRNRWCNQYALTDVQWRKHWYAFLNSI